MSKSTASTKRTQELETQKNPSHTTNLNGTSWMDLVDEMNLQEIVPQRTCEFMLVEESIPTCNIYVQKLRYAASVVDASRCVRSITYDDMKSCIGKFNGDIPELLNFNYTELMQMACLDTEVVFKNLDNVLNFPLNVLARYIKLIAIFYMHCDVQMSKEEAKNAMLKKMKDCYINTRKSPEEIAKEDFQIEDKHTCFLLSGFYRTDLIKELYDMNMVPLGIVEVCDSDEGVYTTECVCNDIPVEERSKKYYSDETEARMHAFWLELYDMLEGDVQYNYLENFFHVQYFGRKQFVESKGSEKYLQNCLAIYGDIEDLILKIYDMQTLHTDYIRNMLKVKLGTCSKIAVDDLKLYPKYLNSIPPEVITVVPILEALLLETESKCGKTAPTKTQQSEVNTNVLTVTKTDISNEQNSHSSSQDNSYSNVDTEASEYILAKILLRDIPPPSQCEMPNFCDFRDTVVNVFKNSKTKYHVKRNEEQNASSAPTSKPFKVNAANDLKIMLSPYKEICDCLIDLHLKYFKKLYPLNLWHNKSSVFEALMHNYDETTPNIFNLNNTEFNDCLNLYFLEAITSTNQIQDHSAKAERLQIQRNFPNRRGFTGKGNITEIIGPSSIFSGQAQNYERVDLEKYKWKETLPPLVLTQNILRDCETYFNVQHVYCPHSQTFALKFSDQCNDFGEKIQQWHECLRTPLCFRDFCKYILNEEMNWILKKIEERKSDEAALKNLIKSKPVAQSFYNRPADFGPTRKTTDKKGKTKGKPEKSKSKDDSKKASVKSQTQVTIKAVSSADLLIKSLEEKLGEQEHRCAIKGEPYNFVGFDLEEKRVQLTGRTVIFQSNEGLRTIVDTTNFINSPQRLSLNITSNNNRMIFHYQPNISQECKVRFCLANGTTVVFTRPEENVENASVLENKAQSKEQVFYYITERRRLKFDYFNVHYTLKNSYLLPESEWRKYKEKFKFLGHKSFVRLRNNLDYPATADAEKGRCFKVEQQRVSKTNFDKSVVGEKDPELAHTTDKTQLKTELKENLKRCKASVPTIPMFKVCCSKIHGYNFLRRLKSYITLPISGIYRRIEHKPRFKTLKRSIEVKKCFKIENKIQNVLDLPFKINLTLPSTLNLATETDCDSNNSFCVKQFYLQKKSQGKTIAKEDYRLYLCSGNVIIKMLNGKTNIYKPNGDIITFNCPINKSSSNRDLQRADFTNVTAKKMSQNDRSYQKALKQTLRRRIRHLIDGPATNLKPSKKLRQHYIKRFFKPEDQYYTEGIDNYTIIKNDGRQLHFIKGKVLERNKYYISNDLNLDAEELLNVRQDGTRMLLLKDGSQRTQFPDGTRIITSIFCETLEVTDDSDDDGYAAPVIQTKLQGNIQQQKVCHDDQSHDRTYEDLKVFDKINMTDSETECVCNRADDMPTKSKDWIVVGLKFEMLHPSYASVIYTTSNDFQIGLPDSMSITKLINGSFDFFIQNTTTANLSSKRIVFLEHPCDVCEKGSKAVINIEPFYNKVFIPENTLLLRVEDSFSKIFECDYSGFCRRNDVFVRVNMNQNYCLNHAIACTKKIYVVKPDFSGDLFWDEQMFASTYNSYINDETAHIFNYDDYLKNNVVTEFQRNIYSNPQDRFLLNYDSPNIHLTSKLQQGKDKVKYVTTILLQSIVKFNTLNHVLNIVKRIQNAINDNCNLSNMGSMIRNITENYYNEEKGGFVNENILSLSKRSMHETKHWLPKWTEKWGEKKKQVCEYQHLFQDHIVPNYFQSSFATDYLLTQCPQAEPEASRSAESALRIDIETDTRDISFELKPKERPLIAVCYNCESPQLQRNENDGPREKTNKKKKDILRIKVPKRTESSVEEVTPKPISKQTLLKVFNIYKRTSDNNVYIRDRKPMVKEYGPTLTVPKEMIHGAINKGKDAELSESLSLRCNALTESRLDTLLDMVRKEAEKEDSSESDGAEYIQMWARACQTDE